ncbi:MAG: hypothetical protein AB1791_16355 [Chloroflexota bacterium]
MRYEVPVIQPNGSVAAGQAHLLERLRREATTGQVRVNAYRGTGIYGSEAFYTLSDGTVLHEVNGTAEDGSDYRTMSLVLEQPGKGFFHRFRHGFRPAAAQ